MAARIIAESAGALHPIAKSQSERQTQRFAGFLNAAAVKIGQMPGRAVVGPAEANLHSAGPLDDELLDRSWIVSGGDRRAEPAGRAVLVEPEAAVGGGDPHQVGGFVIGDDEGPEFAFAPIIALSRHRPGRQTRRGGGDQRGECGQGETGAGHMAWSSDRGVNAKR